MAEEGKDGDDADSTLSGEIKMAATQHLASAMTMGFVDPRIVALGTAIPVDADDVRTTAVQARADEELP